jgi:Helix-turn-helix domain
MSKSSPYRLQTLGDGDLELRSSYGPYSTAKGTYLLTQEEVSRLFRVSVRTVQRWTRLSLIPSVRIGGVTRYDIEEVRHNLGNRDGTTVGLEVVL